MVGENSFGVNISYLEFIRKFGAVPVIISPVDDENPPEVDMILAPGGADLAPTSYGARPGYRTQKPNPQLEYFDANILPQYITNKTPIFAICRGMQRIWAMYGGYIEQHNGWHEQSKSQYDQCHELYFPEEFEDYSKLIKKVTSRHHQCADASVSIPDELEVVAYSAAPGHNKYYPCVVEALRHKELPIFGVQFHPEDHDSTDQLSKMIINEFLGIQ